MHQTNLSVIYNKNKRSPPFFNDQLLLISLARPEGFEPPAFRIGICCDIQLRHGRLFSAFYCTAIRQEFHGLFLFSFITTNPAGLLKPCLLYTSKGGKALSQSINLLPHVQRNLFPHICLAIPAPAGKPAVFACGGKQPAVVVKLDCISFFSDNG